MVRVVKLKKNIGLLDRAIRLILGITLVYIGYFVVNNLLLRAFAIIIGLISIVESIVSYCGFYDMMNISTFGGVNNMEKKKKGCC